MKHTKIIFRHSENRDAFDRIGLQVPLNKMERNEHTTQVKRRHLYKTWWKNLLQNGHLEAAGHMNVMKLDNRKLGVRENGAELLFYCRCLFTPKQRQKFSRAINRN
jgi:hypothetical protein